MFYLGISYLMTGKLEEAIIQLSKLTGSEPNPYSEESHWYLAKAYFKKKNAVSAEKELKAVAALKGARAAEASKALELMKQTGDIPR